MRQDAYKPLKLKKDSTKLMTLLKVSHDVNMKYSSGLVLKPWSWVGGAILEVLESLGGGA
jgi:hypothetical protein